jgi:hypothetical protein
MLAHLPALVAACNTHRADLTAPNERIFLLDLSLGSDESISTALGLRRASVVGIDVGSSRLMIGINVSHLVFVGDLTSTRSYIIYSERCPRASRVGERG